MNKLIKELKHQATDYVDSIDDGLGIEHYREFVDLKFAELIVGECAKVALWEQGKGYDVGEIILKHFGVKE